MSQQKEKAWISYTFFKREEIKLPQGISPNVNTAAYFQGRIALGHENGKVTYIVDENTVKSTQVTQEPIIKIASTPNSQIFYSASKSRNSNLVTISAMKIVGQEQNNQDMFDIIASTELYLENGQKIHYFKTNDDGNVLILCTDLRTVQVFKTDLKKETLTLSNTYQVRNDITNLIFTVDFSLKPVIFITTEAGVSVLRMTKIMKQFEFVEFPGTGPVHHRMSTLVSPGIIATCIPTTSTEQGDAHKDKKSVILFFNRDGLYTSATYQSFIIDEIPEKIIWYRNYLVARIKKKSQFIRIFDRSLHSTIARESFTSIDYLFNIWGSLIILTDIPKTPANYVPPETESTEEEKLVNIKIIRLQEFDNEKKIANFTSKYQFENALQICKMNSMSPEIEAEIHRQHGDFRLERFKDYEGAVEQYKQAIKYIPPSYVTTKFLEPQLAQYLVKYLEALHDEGLETRLHTTLRFNCYTKLRDTEALSKIVDECIKEASDNKEEPSFDIDAAVNVLSSGGYIDKAITIAKAYHKWDIYCTMLARKNNYAAIFEALKTMPTTAAQRNINTYGTSILEDASMKSDFTDFVAQACIDGLTNSADEAFSSTISALKSNISLSNPSLLANSGQNYAETDNSQNQSSKKIVPDDVYAIFIQDPQMEFRFYRKIIKQDASILSQPLWNRSITLCLSLCKTKITKIIEHPQAKYLDEFAEIAIDLEEEKISGRRKKYKQLTKDLKTKPDTPVPDWFKTYDEHKEKQELDALLKARAFVYGKRGCYREIIAITRSKNLLSVCQKYAGRDPGIWGEAMQKALTKDHPEVCREMLQYVLQNNIIRLNELLNAMTKKTCATFDMFSNLAIEVFQELNKLINEKLVKLENADKKLEGMYEQAEQLNKEPYHIVQNRKCASCEEELAGSVRYFKCGHYFHLSCLGDEPEKCPICSNRLEDAAVRKLQRIEDMNKQDELLPKMVGADDGIDILERVLETGIMMDDNITEKDVRAFYDKLFGE